ncbi:hypothetical protein RINGS_89 [Arthrobacter phage Rings]|uniref:Uncharacterized protein n=1 Tax=Arthrobacter phage Rings TaxID=1772313 RepID=A0A0U4KA90_9CAUD|nr:hypothetical protein RINGS_89 [Arthrobacter phage Rings]
MSDSVQDAERQPVERSDPVIQAVVIGDVPKWLDDHMRGTANKCRCYPCFVRRERLAARAVVPEPLADWERELLDGVRAEINNRTVAPWEL